MKKRAESWGNSTNTMDMPHPWLKIQQPHWHLHGEHTIVIPFTVTILCSVYLSGFCISNQGTGTRAHPEWRGPGTCILFLNQTIWVALKKRRRKKHVTIKRIKSRIKTTIPLHQSNCKNVIYVKQVVNQLFVKSVLMWISQHDLML